MADSREHPYIPTLKRQLAERTLDRREFLRTATLLGMSAGAAYAFAGKVTGERLVPAAEAQTPPKGGDAPARHAVPGPQEPPHLQLDRVGERGAAGVRLPGRHGRGQHHAARPGREVGGQPRPQDVDAPHPAQRQVAQRPGVHGRRRRLEPQARPRRQDGIVHGRPHEGVHPRGVRDRREGRQGQREEVHPPLGRQRHPEGRRLHRAAERQDPAARDSRAPLPLPAAHPGPGRERRVQGRLERHRRLHDGRERGRAEAGLQGEARLLGRRPVPRHARVHRSRRRRRRQGQRAGRQAGRRPVPGRHHPAGGAPEAPAPPALPGPRRPTPRPRACIPSSRSTTSACARRCGTPSTPPRSCRSPTAVSASPASTTT